MEIILHSQDLVLNGFWRKKFKPLKLQTILVKQKLEKMLNPDRISSVGKPYASTLKFQPKQACDANTQTFTDSSLIQSQYLYSIGHTVQKPSTRP